MFYVYILKCIGNDHKISLYTGYTNDLRRRFSEHSSGRGARFTRGKMLELVFYQVFTTQHAAMQREIEIKRLSRQRKWALIENRAINQHLA